jgi:hypothetical protein
MAAMAAVAVGAVAAGYMQYDAANKAQKAGLKAAAAAGDARAQSILRLAEAQEKLEKIGVPTAEAQRIVLEEPNLVGLEDVREIGPSEFMKIDVDPEFQESQIQSLAKMKEFGDVGLTAGERGRNQMASAQSSAEEQARQKAILQDFAQRGVEGSGLELAARLSSSQEAAQRRSMEQAKLIDDAEKRRMTATQNIGQMSTDMRGQAFDEQAQAATAEDLMRRFQETSRSAIENRNLNRRQAKEDMRAANRNKERAQYIEQKQQEFDNEMSKQSHRTNLATGQARQHDNQANDALAEGRARSEGEIRRGDAIAGGIEGIAGGVAKYNSGGSKKATIDKVPDDDEGELLDNDYSSGSSGYGFADGGMVPMMLPQEQPGYEEGGIMDDKYAGGGIDLEGVDSEIIPGDDFAGDRVDAKINSGEMVINVEQQQRLMDLLKGLRDVQSLGDEDIVEPVAEAVPMPEEMPPMPPEEMPPMPPEAPMPQFNGGGVVRDGREYEDLSMSDMERFNAMSDPEMKKLALRKAGENQRAFQISDSEKAYENGGIVLPREVRMKEQLSEEYSKLSDEADEQKERQKQQNARMKAIETLVGIDRSNKNG